MSTSWSHSPFLDHLPLSREQHSSGLDVVSMSDLQEPSCEKISIISHLLGIEREEEVMTREERELFFRATIVYFSSCTQHYVLSCIETREVPHITEELFQLAIEEWIPLKPTTRRMYILGGRVFDKLVSETPHYCICGSDKHKSDNVLLNIKNGCHLPISLECINKFDMQFALDYLKVLTAYKRGFRLCHSCITPNIKNADEKWRTRCAECYSQNILVNKAYAIHHKYRECNICFNLAIPGTELERVKECNSCYNTRNISKDHCLPCRECKVKNISPKEDFKELCVNCFVSTNAKSSASQPSSSSNCRACNICKKNVIFLSEPSWKTKCLKCYIASK